MNLQTWKEQNAAHQAELHSAPCQQFGLLTLQQFRGRICDSLFNAFTDSGVWAVQHPAAISAAVETNRPFSILVGFKPSRFHVGHLTLAREVSRLMRLGGLPIFVVAGYEAGQLLSEQEARDKVSEFWTILNSSQRSADSLPADVVSDRDCMDLRLLEDRVAETLTVNKLSRLYGWDGATSVATMRVPGMSAAAFLLPQRIHPERPTVVLSDIKQVTHAEVTKIAARALELPPPMFSYRTLLPSLTGPDERMSVKKPRSVIFLDESADAVAGKLKKCYSGGKETPDLQRTQGGNPDRCSFFRIAETALPEDRASEMLAGCVSGSTLCGECKCKYSPQLIETLTTLMSRV